MSVLNESSVESAILFLAQSATELADARATLVSLEEGRKSLKAQLMKQSEAKSNDMREADAYDHPDYRDLIAGLVEATRQSERLRLRRENALTLIEVWRTAQANNRALDRIK